MICSILGTINCSQNREEGCFSTTRNLRKEVGNGLRNQTHVNETYAVLSAGNEPVDRSVDTITGYDPDDDEEKVPSGWEQSCVTPPTPRGDIPVMEDLYSDARCIDLEVTATASSASA